MDVELKSAWITDRCGLKISLKKPTELGTFFSLNLAVDYSLSTICNQLFTISMYNV